MVALALALAGCPQPKDNTAEADLRAEVARLKAQAEADEKAKSAAAVATAEADAARAQADAAQAKQAQANAAADARSAAEIAEAEAAFAKAQAEADEAAKAAVGVQEEFLAAEAEHEKALQEAEEAKKEAEQSVKVAEASDASEKDVDEASAAADRAAAQAARAEAARLKKELARAKASAATQKIRAPISQGILNILSALFTPVTSPSGGPIYSFNSNGSILVRPGTLSPSSPPLLMNAVTNFRPLAPPGTLVMATAQLLPSPQFFNPPLEVFFDLQTPGTYVGEPIRVMLDDPSRPGNLIPYTPDTWATVTNNLNIAMARMPHFTTVALVKPKPGDPTIPPKGAPIDPPPMKQDAIAKEKAEEAAQTAELKQAAANYQVMAKTAKLQYATRAKKEETKDLTDKTAREVAARKAKAEADKKAKAQAERKAAEAEKKKAAKALADQKARNKAREQQERDRKAGEALGSVLRALGGSDANADQQQQQQRQQQEEQRRRQQQQQQPNEDFPGDG